MNPWAAEGDWTCDSSPSGSTTPHWLQNKTHEDIWTLLCCMLSENVVIGVAPLVWFLCISSRVYVVPRCLYLFVPGQGWHDHQSVFLSRWLLFCWLAWWRPLNFSETVTQQERRGNNRGGLTFPQQAHATTQAWACCGMLVKRFVRIELCLSQSKWYFFINSNIKLFLYS